MTAKTKADLTINFGDGCDGDTLSTVLGGLTGYNLGLDLATPRDLVDWIEVRLLSVAPMGQWGVMVQRIEIDGVPYGEPFYLTLDDITSIEIY